MNTPRTNGRRLWWLPHLYEGLSFVFGIALIAFEQVYGEGRVVFVVAGLAAMGILPAGQLQRALLGRLEK